MSESTTESPAPVPSAEGDAWHRHNEFGGVIETVSAEKMAEVVAQTIALDAQGQRWTEGGWGWRYEYDPDHNRITEAVWAETLQLGVKTGRYYTRPKSPSDS